MSAPPAGPNPFRIFQTLGAFEQSFALKAAIDLDVFTAIADGIVTATSLASHCKASQRGVRSLCDALTSMDFLTKSGEAYGLTADSALFLNRHSQAYLGGAATFLLNDTMVRSFADVGVAVRLGGTTLTGEGTVSEENPVWVDFAHGMGPMMFPAAQEIATRILAETGGSPTRVLDMAAGHGMFGISVAQHHPLAEITALDWAPVLAVAEANAAKMGVGARHHKLPGDAFETDFGTGWDLILITNFLHHFDPETNVKLLRKVKAALAPGGRAITLEFVPNADRVSPPTQAFFSLVMLATTRAGDAYTSAEYERMFADAGFEGGVDCVALNAAPQSVIIARA